MFEFLNDGFWNMGYHYIIDKAAKSRMRNIKQVLHDNYLQYAKGMYEYTCFFIARTESEKFSHLYYLNIILTLSFHLIRIFCGEELEYYILL